MLLQPKILRALECREMTPVGVTRPRRIFARMMAATHRNVGALAEKGEFRSDLYYRLSAFEIEIPPLRERPDDVAPLASHLLKRLCGQMTRPTAILDPEALRALERYAWAGNVRELANVLEHALILSSQERLGIADLPTRITTARMHFTENLDLARSAFERAHVLRVIERYGGDKSRAAGVLGISRSSLYRKIGQADPEPP